MTPVLMQVISGLCRSASASSCPPGSGQDASVTTTSAVIFDNDKRPPWLNWVFLALFLFSSWQLAGMWFSQLHQG